MSWAMVSKEGWETRGDSKVTWSLAGMLGFCFPLFWVEGGRCVDIPSVIEIN